MEITNSYVAGTIRAAATGSSGNYAGGLIGAINNNASGVIKATGAVVVADEITGGVPNLFIGTELQNTKLTYENIFARNDITLAYANENNKGTGAAMVQESMKRNPQDFLDGTFYEGTLGWDFESIWKMGQKYPVFQDQNDSGSGVTFLSEEKNCTISTVQNGVKIIPLEKLSVAIYDITGKLVYHSQHVSQTVQVFLTSGMYVIKTICQGVMDVVKVAVM
jgi:hypothetical protein